MTTTPTPTVFNISRVETYEGGRFSATLDDLREFIPDLDLTGIPADKIGAHIEDQLFAHNDCGVSEWLDKHSECTDSETTIIPFLHVCAGCGEPIVKMDGEWRDAYLCAPRCGGWGAGAAHGPADETADETADEPEPADLGALQDAVTDALTALIRAHLAVAHDEYKGAPDHHELAYALNGVIRDALTEALDTDSPEPINDTPRADVVMDVYPSWPMIEEALDEAHAIARGDLA